MKILEIFLPSRFELQVVFILRVTSRQSTIDRSLFRERGSKYFSSPFDQDDDEALMYRESYVYAFRY